MRRVLQSFRNEAAVIVVSAHRMNTTGGNGKKPNETAAKLQGLFAKKRAKNTAAKPSGTVDINPKVTKQQQQGEVTALAHEEKLPQHLRQQQPRVASASQSFEFEERPAHTSFTPQPLKASSKASLSQQPRRISFADLDDEEALGLSDEAFVKNIAAETAMLNEKEGGSLSAAELYGEEGDTDNLLAPLDALDGGTGQQHDAVFSFSDQSDGIHEHELLDDNFSYFPAISTEAERRVPGQEVLDPNLTRYRFEIQYRGDDFHGFSNAIRRTRKTEGGSKVSEIPDAKENRFGKMVVREVLEDALAVALDVDGVKVITSCTPERGVHVNRLTCHVDIPSSVGMQSKTVVQRAQAWLSKTGAPLAILNFKRCKRTDDFNAHYAATRRVYCYRIMNRVAPPLFEKGCHWHLDRQLDVKRMQWAANKYFEGTVDFRNFAALKIQRKLLSRGDIVMDGSVGFEKNPVPQHTVDTTITVRTMDRVQVVRQEDEILLWFAGRSFLRHQIRHMVGTLVYVGLGLWDDQELQQFMDRKPARNHREFWSTRPPRAPVHGLTLWEVQYPEDTTQTPKFTDRGQVDPESSMMRQQMQRYGFGY